MRFYHNTVITPEAPFRNSYAAGFAKAMKDRMQQQKKR